jgi:hypothetical protein
VAAGHGWRMSAGGELTGEGAGWWWGSVAGGEFRRDRDGGVLFFLDGDGGLEC